MKIELSASALEWQAKAREYADEYLQPHEVEAELNGGVLPEEITTRNKSRAIELGFSSIDVPGDWDGRGYMRENVAERFFRELRLDRILEGTSEIQCLIIARNLLNRGLDHM